MRFAYCSTNTALANIANIIFKICWLFFIDFSLKIELISSSQNIKLKNKTKVTG